MTRLNLALVIIFSVLMLASIACSSDGGEPEHQEIAINLSDGNWDLASDTLKIAQGDTVALSIASEEHGTVHLHGYDIEIPVGPDEAGDLNFDAAATGRFNITFHAGAEEGADGDADHTEESEDHEEGGEEEASLGAIEIHPR